MVQILVFQGIENMAGLHSWLNTEADEVSKPFVHVLAQRFYFTHMYIPLQTYIKLIYNYI